MTFYTKAFPKNALQKLFFLAIFILALFAIYSCNFTFGGKEEPIDPNSIWKSSIEDKVLPPQKPYTNGKNTVYVDFSDIRQEIDGFGGSNAWTGLPSGQTGTEVVKLLYSKTEGIGLTILRNRIPFRERYSGYAHSDWNDGFMRINTDESYKYTEKGGVKTFELNWGAWDLGNTKTLIQKIKALGGNGPESLTLMSTPWTPPNNKKTNWKTGVKNMNEPDVGGRLDPAHYEDYADLLADYALNFEKNMGVPLSVLSIQNEPSWAPDYESCLWTGDEIRDFLIVLGQRFKLKDVSTSLGIMAPEDENFREDAILPSLDEPLASKVLTHVGLHQYEGVYTKASFMGAEKLSQTSKAGKRIWQTEISSNEFNKMNQVPSGGGIEDALYYAQMIHYDMTIAELNAFLYWWLWTNGSDEFDKASLIATKGSTIYDFKRLYAMGQYSRFIRPGWVRVGATDSPSNGVFTTAYKDPKSNEFAIVFVNTTDAIATIELDLNKTIGSYEIWRTSDKESLKKIETSSEKKVSLSEKSITTIVGTITN